MESKDELKETDIKNRTCYYFDNIIRARNRDIYSTDILLDEELWKENHENILIYDISYKTSMGAKPLRIRFDKKDGDIKVHDQIRHLVLFDYGSCDKIWDKTKYLLTEKVVF